MPTESNEHIMLLDKGIGAFARLLVRGTEAQHERLIALAKSGTEAELMELLAEVDEEAVPDAEEA